MQRFYANEEIPIEEDDNECIVAHAHSIVMSRFSTSLLSCYELPQTYLLLFIDKGKKLVTTLEACHTRQDELTLKSVATDCKTGKGDPLYGIEKI